MMQITVADGAEYFRWVIMLFMLYLKWYYQSRHFTLIEMKWHFIHINACICIVTDFNFLKLIFWDGFINRIANHCFVFKCISTASKTCILCVFCLCRFYSDVIFFLFSLPTFSINSSVTSIIVINCAKLCSFIYIYIYIYFTQLSRTHAKTER